jgi:hypothetical protein
VRPWERKGKQRIRRSGFSTIKEGCDPVGKEHTNERRVFEMED